MERPDDDAAGGLGGIGVLGAEPDGEIESRADARRDGGPVDAPSPTDTEGTDAELIDDGDDRPRSPTDRYCGNCGDFEYARERSTGEMIPYCTRHEGAMTGMDACEEWTPNRR